METTNEQSHIFLHDVYYSLEYRFIPSIIEWITDGKIEPWVLWNFEWWKEYLKDHPVGQNFPWDKLSCETYKIDDGHELIVYIFPEPLDSPLAALGAVFIDKIRGGYRYHTLELSVDSSWVRGGMTLQGHANYGFFEQPNVTQKDFTDWVIALYMSKQRAKNLGRRIRNFIKSLFSNDESE